MTEERTKQTALAAYLRHWHFFEKILGCLVLLGVVALLACQLWLGQSNGRSDVWYGLDYAEALPAVQQTDGLWGSVTLDYTKQAGTARLPDSYYILHLR